MEHFLLPHASAPTHHGQRDWRSRRWPLEPIDNREAWPGMPWEPADPRPRHDHSALWAAIEDAGARSFGQPQAGDFRWPLNQEEALVQLEAFVQHALPYFGRFQDAMSYKAWRLFHSLLSFAMNVKMLSPHRGPRVEQAGATATRPSPLPKATSGKSSAGGNTCVACTGIACRAMSS
jgi:deoxyribodipyrimidine photolyase-like uncharacterized protein